VWFACAVLLFVAYAYPGFMSFDSSWQLGEGRAWHFSDWHPPVMAALWGVLDRIISGPLLMLVVQAGAFVAGVLVLVRKRCSPDRALVAAGVLLLFPPIATTLAVIWKDSQVLGLVMLGTALLAPPASMRARIAGCGVLTLATAMRHNAFTVTLALVVMLLDVPARTRVRRYAAATAVWIAMTLAAFGANRLLTDTPMHPWQGSLAVFDVIGTLHYARPLADAEIRDTLRGTRFADTPPLQHRVDRAYKPFDGVFRDFEVHFIEQPANDAERAAIARAFRTAVTAHPFAYLHHRFVAFREVMHPSEPGFDHVYTGYDRWSGVSHTPGAVQAQLIAWAHDTGESFLYWPLLYLLAACVAGVYAFRRRDRLVLALVASALISELSLFVLSPTPDFRYSIWLVAVAVLVPWLGKPASSAEFGGDN